MLEEGANILEIGGESTGPKSREVSVDEERNRVMPLLTAIRSKFPDARLAVDTWKSVIAAEALTLGAAMINDVTAGRGDPNMFSVITPTKASLVLMHAKDATPRTTVEAKHYDDVMATIKFFLKVRIDAATAVGIDRDRIIIDPGLGQFISSVPEYSFQILARLAELSDLGCPLLVSPSRKSFLAGPEKLPASERLPGTIAASAIAVLQGATYIRTHDVKETRRACDIALSIRSQ